jgi:pimeloyl-ACP methyl ester carboxylesterase
MDALSPAQAATIASEVYTLHQEHDIAAAVRRSDVGLGIQDIFQVDSTSRFEATSGALAFRKRSGFGFVAHGIGRRQGEALIAIRGTITSRDWLTDGNIGLQMGPGSWPVHAGFNTTFKSFSDRFQMLFRNRNPSVVHCVGHSLGGALATLAADLISEGRLSGVKLYTFGSPRVGISGFARKLSRKVGGHSIYRVSHNADPVAMIPIFPFAHVPDPGPSYMMDWSGGRVAASAHFMEHYMDSIGNAAWGNLARPADAPDWDAHLRDWLESASSGSARMFSAEVLWLITKALAWIVKECLIVAVGTTLTVGATVLDRLAYLLHTGALASTKIARWLENLIRRIFQYLGRTANTVGALSVAFVRWVLGLLFRSLATTAGRALSMLELP